MKELQKFTVIDFILIGGGGLLFFIDKGGGGERKRGKIESRKVK